MRAGGSLDVFLRIWSVSAIGGTILFPLVTGVSVDQGLVFGLIFGTAFAAVMTPLMRFRTVRIPVTRQGMERVTAEIDLLLTHLGYRLVTRHDDYRDYEPAQGGMEIGNMSVNPQKGFRITVHLRAGEITIVGPRYPVNKLEREIRALL